MFTLQHLILFQEDIVENLFIYLFIVSYCTKLKEIQSVSFICYLPENCNYNTLFKPFLITNVYWYHHFIIMFALSTKQYMHVPHDSNWLSHLTEFVNCVVHCEDQQLSPPDLYSLSTWEKKHQAPVLGYFQKPKTTEMFLFLVEGSFKNSKPGLYFSILLKGGMYEVLVLRTDFSFWNYVY